MLLSKKGDMMTTKCHEFLECTEKDCVMFEKEEQKNCWEIAPVLTPCINREVGDIDPDKKFVFCRKCFYYKHVHKIMFRDCLA